MTQPPEEGIRITRPLRDVEEFWVVPKVAAPEDWLCVPGMLSVPGCAVRAAFGSGITTPQEARDFAAQLLAAADAAQFPATETVAEAEPVAQNASGERCITVVFTEDSSEQDARELALEIARRAAAADVVSGGSTACWVLGHKFAAEDSPLGTGENIPFAVLGPVTEGEVAALRGNGLVVNRIGWGFPKPPEQAQFPEWVEQLIANAPRTFSTSLQLTVSLS